MKWIHENPAYWNADKTRIVGGAEPGIFDVGDHVEGEIVPGDWWRVENDAGDVLGYGWMDTVWGDAQILLAVSQAQRNAGVGTFIVDQLEREARARGLNHLYNVVSDKHPDKAGITKWLNERGFHPSEDGRDLRRVVPRKGAG